MVHSSWTWFNNFDGSIPICRWTGQLTTNGPAVKFLIDPLPSLGQQQVHVTRYFDVIIGAWWLTNFPANWKSNVRVTVKTGYTVSIRGEIRSACLHGVELPFAVGKKKCCPPDGYQFKWASICIVTNDLVRSMIRRNKGPWKQSRRWTRLTKKNALSAPGNESVALIFPWGGAWRCGIRIRSITHLISVSFSHKSDTAVSSINYFSEKNIR